MLSCPDEVPGNTMTMNNAGLHLIHSPRVLRIVYFILHKLHKYFLWQEDDSIHRMIYACQK